MIPALEVLSYSGITSYAHHSMLRTASAGRYPWQIFEGLSPDACVGRARSALATRVLDSPHIDVLLMVDHDVSWREGDAEHIVELAHEREGVVGGLVSKRAHKQGFGGRLVDSEQLEIGSRQVVELPEDAYLGGAFMAFSRKVIEKLADVLPRTRDGIVPAFLPILKHNPRIDCVEWLSEDWAFCHAARLVNAPVLLTMHPVLAHWSGVNGYTPIEGNPGPAIMGAK